MKTVSQGLAAFFLSGLALGASRAAPPYALPDNLPAREPGLWESVVTGMRGPNEIERITRYCLDAHADRALHELDVLSRELSVIYEDVGCRPPEYTVSGNVLHATLMCRTNRSDDSEQAGQDFNWTLTYNSEREVLVKMHSASRDTLIMDSEDLTGRQRWLGACTPGHKPGDMRDVRFTVNGKPGHKSPPDNVFESVKITTKMLNEAIDINRRLGPM